ncbi:diguanylate cyclase [Sphaerotilus hippei]|nr:diguanylate cyclase [Sphaerotilus hippei]
MKSTRGRLNMVLAGVSAVAMLVSGSVFHAALSQDAHEDVRREAVLQMATAQAVRAYTSEHVRDALLQHDGPFPPAAVPSFSAVTTMKYLQQAYPDYRYQELAINPTQPDNRARGWELQVIEAFRAGGAEERFLTTGSGAAQMLHYARPLRVVNEACLRCHGSPEAAPAALVAKYGRQGGFGWRVGEVVGAQIVSVPARTAFARVDSTFLHYLGASAALFLSFFAVLNWMLSRTVLQPIVSSNQRLAKLASRDGLTGAANRRRFLAQLDGEIRRCGTQGAPLSVIMIDLDHFKRINDEHGHAVGDEVLRSCCRRVKRRLGPSDVLGRLGGEEFAVLLPATDESGAGQMAALLLLAISGKPMQQAGQVTASLGVARHRAGETGAQLLERADAALYRAKREGRNRVVRAAPLIPVVPGACVAG